MGEPDRSVWLATRLAAGVAALRAGRPLEAAPLLAEVCDDPEMIAAADMLDVRTRASSLCGQALFQIGRFDEAHRRTESALALARKLGDVDGVHEIEVLLDQIREAATRAPPPIDPKAEELLGRSVAEIEARARDPFARAELLVRKANAEIEAGRATEAVETARAALRAAPAVPRIGVLARLTIARADPSIAEGVLREAVVIARDADEFTLVGLVGRAAALAGVQLDIQVGPERGPR